MSKKQSEIKTLARRAIKQALSDAANENYTPKDRKALIEAARSLAYDFGLNADGSDW